jgi:hypothetical protein
VKILAVGWGCSCDIVLASPVGGPKERKKEERKENILSGKIVVSQTICLNSTVSKTFPSSPLLTHLLGLLEY